MPIPMNTEKNMGDQTSKYPDAADIPQVKMSGMEKPPETNPVVSAFETIMKYVKGLEDRKDPKAVAMKEHLTAMIQAVVGGSAEGAAPEDEQGMAKKPVAGQEPADGDDGMEQEAEPIKPVDGPTKMGFDPYKDPSEDEGMEESEDMKKKRMMKKGVMQNKSITPLA
jgi:hypothetical protein